MKKYFERCLSIKRRAPPPPVPSPPALAVLQWAAQRGKAKQSIIAMKGAPFTRKTEFANHIAKSLKCPVLSVDHYLDVLHPQHFETSASSSSSSSSPSPHPRDLAFQIICRITASHLSEGICAQVVIDSPLSCRSHLDQLIELASSLRQTQLLIIECKPTNVYLWQTKFEEYLLRNPNRIPKWYKAKNWDDIEKAIREYYDERSDGYSVSKLVLDPLSDYICDQPHRAYFLSNMILRPPPFIEALNYMTRRNKGDGPDVVVYRQWQQSQRFPYEIEFYDGEIGQFSEGQWFCKIGHRVTNYTEEGLGYQANCMACQEQIMGAAYSCEDCSLALHKECVESFDSSNTWGNPCPDFKYNFRYRFPEWSVCASCKEAGCSVVSKYCDSCLFETHLKSRLMPTIIRHDCDEHFLSILLPNVSAYQMVQQCKACGDPGRCDLYVCKICSVAYHYKCLTEVPHRVEHVHGLHHHHMLLKFSSPKAEDYICDICFENGDSDRRDPKQWYYACEECVYVAHLDCIHPIRSSVTQ